MRKHRYRNDEARTKRCPRCETWKAFDEFESLPGAGPSRSRPYCRACERELSKERGPESHRKYGLRSRAKKLGTTYEVLAQADDPTKPCEICGKVVKLVIDHNHETQKFRGFLCSMCNSGLGYFGDDLSVLKSAVEYLERSQE